MKNKTILKVRTAKSEGFTIIELMIALSVLSIILVTTSAVMIQIGSLYTKGVNSADLQNMNRSIVNDIATAIQFSGSAPSPVQYNSATKTYAFCVDNTRYSYVLHQEQGTDPYAAGGPLTTYHVLWRDNLPNGTACTPLYLDITGTPAGSTKGYDVLEDHMRLTQLSVNEIGASDSGIYTVTVSLAYGHSDLLLNGDTQCDGNTGTQYCAVSTISTTVARRIKD